MILAEIAGPHDVGILTLVHGNIGPHGAPGQGLGARILDVVGAVLGSLICGGVLVCMQLYRQMFV